MTALHGATHIVIPDCQVRPGSPIDHLFWLSQYVVDKFYGRANVKIINLGDMWDFPSLSSYDKGTKAAEGRRVLADIDAGNTGMLALNSAIDGANVGHRRKWKPERHLLRGNHENRLARAINSDASLDGVLSFDSLLSPGWQVHDFLVPVMLDGVAYAHYWYAPMSGRPLGGMIETRLKNIGTSFTQGHQQTLAYGLLHTAGGIRHGLVAGAFYIQDEDYKGPQANGHWRGAVVCHEVEDGRYDPMFLSLDYLCRRYEGVRMSEFSPRRFA